MPKRPRRPALVAAVLASVVAAGARAGEPTRVEPLWIDALAPDGTVARTIPALLNVPPGWMIGDAAVVVLSDGPWPGLARERIVAALLGEVAAVLELDVDTARGFSPENAWNAPPATPQDVLADVLAAAETLRREAGAGLVVALGHGAGGEAAMLAVALERSERPPANGRAEIAVAASLGPGAARFALGGAATGPGWPVRAELLCRVLATEAVPSQPDAEADCRRALVAPGETYAARAGKP